MEWLPAYSRCLAYYSVCVILQACFPIRTEVWCVPCAWSVLSDSGHHVDIIDAECAPCSSHLCTRILCGIPSQTWHRVFIYVARVVSEQTEVKCQ